MVSAVLILSNAINIVYFRKQKSLKIDNTQSDKSIQARDQTNMFGYFNQCIEKVCHKNRECSLLV